MNTHINFTVFLAGLFLARLRSLACPHPSSRPRRCAATPGPTGRPPRHNPAITLARADASGTRRRPLRAIRPCSSLVICRSAPPLELPPSPELCGRLRRWTRWTSRPWRYWRVAASLEHGPWWRAWTSTALPSVSPGRQSAVYRCGCSLVGRFVLALQPRMLSPCMLSAGLFCCRAAFWAGCWAWRPA